MPQIVMYAKASNDQVMDALAKAAKKTGFTIDEEKNTRMTIRKGSVGMAILLGWFVQYVVADVKVAEADDEELKVTIEWKNAWFRGLVAMMQNPGQMKAFADSFENVLEDDGGEVLDRKNK